MLFTVEIDDTSKTGKSIIHLLQDLSKTVKGIHVIETLEDDILLAKMKQSLKSGKVGKEEINKTIKSILEK